MTYLYRYGAHIVFGDIEESACEAAVKQVTSTIQSSSSLDFLKIDITKYDEVVELFEYAYKKHGRVDHAFNIAGVTETAGENWFTPSLDLQSVKAAPATTIVDINVTGTLYFVRVAAVYLRQKNEDRSQDKSICLLGSVASFKEQAGLFVYQPTKHGVLGLVRSTRKYFDAFHGIRINTVCPSMTKTRMATPILDLWDKYGVRGNEPHEIAEHVLTLTSVPHSPYGAGMTGLAVFVEAGKGWEIEHDLDRFSPSWMGEEMAKNALKIEQALGNGGSWVNPN